MSIEGILRGCMLQGWRYSPLAWSHRSLLNGTRSTGSQIGIGGSPNRPPAALGLCQVFPHPVLMKPNRIGVSDDEILVGFVGRLTEIKNIPMFLKTAGIYKERKNSDFPKLRFVIIGDGHLRARLEAEAENLDVRDVVSFLGNRSDADVFYAGLDIVALTSLNEGTPLSLIEAMANGKAFVSTAVGGVTDLLGAVAEEKENFKVYERGIGVASGDAQPLFEGLIFLEREEISQKGLG